MELSLASVLHSVQHSPRATLRALISASLLVNPGVELVYSAWKLSRRAIPSGISEAKLAKTNMVHNTRLSKYTF